jgi:hypothetical protein
LIPHGINGPVGPVGEGGIIGGIGPTGPVTGMLTQTLLKHIVDGGAQSLVLLHLPPSETLQTPLTHVKPGPHILFASHTPPRGIF